MKTTLYFTILATIVYIGVAMCTMVALADTSEPFPATIGTEETWNRNTWFSASHPKPANFTVTNTGAVYGVTVDGTPFQQTPIPTTTGIRIHRFTMQSHHHFIVEGIAVYTLSDLSIRLAVLEAERRSL